MNFCYRRTHLLLLPWLLNMTNPCKLDCDINGHSIRMFGQALPQLLLSLQDQRTTRHEAACPVSLPGPGMGSVSSQSHNSTAVLHVLNVAAMFFLCGFFWGAGGLSPMASCLCQWRDLKLFIISFYLIQSTCYVTVGYQYSLKCIFENSVLHYHTYNWTLQMWT